MQRLGQHFLKNKSAVRESIDALGIETNDIVIEIGPGEGALTFDLLSTCERIGAHLVVIERDENLAQQLQIRFESQGKEVMVVTGDALIELPRIVALYQKKVIRVIGNIPYYITGYLLRVLSELSKKPARIVLMIQKEVADRLIAKPPKMNILAASVCFWAKPAVIKSLKQSDFSPPPKVLSSIITLSPLLEKREIDEKLYFKLLHIVFKQPRKTLLNNLAHSDYFPNKNAVQQFIEQHDFTTTTRAQELSVDTLIALATALPTEPSSREKENKVQ